MTGRYLCRHYAVWDGGRCILARQVEADPTAAAHWIIRRALWIADHLSVPAAPEITAAVSNPAMQERIAADLRAATTTGSTYTSIMTDWFDVMNAGCPDSRVIPVTQYLTVVRRSLAQMIEPEWLCEARPSQVAS